MKAKAFIAVFERTEELLNGFTFHSDPKKIEAFNVHVYQPVANIWAYKRKVLGLISRYEIRSNNYVLLVDHTTREAAYFANQVTSTHSWVIMFLEKQNDLLKSLIFLKKT